MVTGTPAGEDLGQLAAGRPATEHEQAARQLAGERRLLVRPRLDLGQALDRWHLRVDPTATTTLSVSSSWVRSSCVTATRPRPTILATPR